jgi:hypothetical protein
MKAVMMLALGFSIAQAAEPTGTLTLACQGTTIIEGKQTEPVSMSISINFADRSVHGFGGGAIVKITNMDELTIDFDGTDPKAPNQVTSWDVHGNMDRVTGYVWATISLRGPAATSSMRHSLKCKPTQRIF